MTNLLVNPAPALHARAKVDLLGIDTELPPGYLCFDRILMLDIDGVLHPEGGDQGMLFCFMPEFCELLREVDPCGEMPIVITSTWRLTETIANIRAHFPGDIGRQILGVTSEIMPGARMAWEMHGGPASSPAGMRQQEVQAWMDTYAPAGQWLALDDRASLFEDDCPFLFHVPGLHHNEGGGISSLVAADLRDRLKEFLDFDQKITRSIPADNVSCSQ